MRFKWKIFWLCISLYTLSLSGIGVVVTENNYSTMLLYNTNSYLELHDATVSGIKTFLLINASIIESENLNKEYATEIVELFGKNNKKIQLFDISMHTLASNLTSSINPGQLALKRAVNGEKNFVLRKLDYGSLCFISELIEHNKHSLVITTVYDATHIDTQRKEQYLTFLRVGIFGLLFVVILALLISSKFIAPLRKLMKTVSIISNGDYSKRAEIIGKDELGELAQQFNTMADKIQQNIEQLRNEAEVKQRFIDNLTHELRTPMTSVIGYADLLYKSEYDKELFKKSLKYIADEGKRLQKLTERLTDIYIYNNCKLELVELDINEIINRALKILSPVIDNKSIDITVKIEENYFLVDADMMLEVVCNLLQNAINASQYGSNIEIGSRIYKTKRCIYIKDYGCGMSQSELKKILEAFYRVDKSRSRKHGGMGLGVSISKHILDMHRAELSYESELGKGTLVRIVFK